MQVSRTGLGRFLCGTYSRQPHYVFAHACNKLFCVFSLQMLPWNHHFHCLKVVLIMALQGCGLQRRLVSGF